MYWKHALTFVLTGLFYCHSALADIRWDFSGFATIGTGKTNRDELLYMDYDGDWSFDSDTVLGLQLVVEPLDRLSLTAQVVTRGHSFDNSAEYSTENEWFFLSYNLDSSSRIRVGRLRTPYQYYSESLEVGYSYVWARPPANVYAFLFEPFSHFDGVDYSYTHYGDSVDTEFKLLYGTQKGNFLATQVDIDQIWGFSFSTRWQDLTLRYGFLDHTANLTIPEYAPVINGLNEAAAIDPGFAELTELYRLERGRMRYHSLALDWRIGHWHIIAERYELEPPDKQLNNSSRGWYLSFARQFGHLTPYFVVGAYKSAMGKEMYDQVDGVYERVEPLYPFLLPGQVEGLEMLRQSAISTINLNVVGQRSYTTGLRYDFLANAALKVELEYLEFSRGSTGHLIGKTYAVDRQSDPNDAMSYTIVVDVVF